MKTDDLVKHFGGVTAAAKHLGITRSAIYQWGKYVPETTAWRVQVMTAGKLQVEAAAYRKDRRVRI